MSWARGSAWHVTGLGVQAVDCCRDSGGGADGPGEQGEVAGEGSCEENWFL